MACFGEPVYTEKPGDISELDLPPGIATFVKELRKVSDDITPIILALVEGRPRLLGDLPQTVRSTQDFFVGIYDVVFYKGGAALRLSSKLYP